MDPLSEGVRGRTGTLPTSRRVNQGREDVTHPVHRFGLPSSLNRNEPGTVEGPGKFLCGPTLPSLSSVGPRRTYVGRDSDSDSPQAVTKRTADETTIVDSTTKQGTKRVVDPLS